MAWTALVVFQPVILSGQKIFKETRMIVKELKYHEIKHFQGCDDDVYACVLISTRNYCHTKNSVVYGKRAHVYFFVLKIKRFHPRLDRIDPCA